MDIVTLAASIKYTDKKIAESAAVGIKYEIVDSLPSSGEAQTIYFVKNDSSWINNYYDEYVWISSSGSFEKIGSTQLDDFIQNPSAAEVGQTIVVKEVNKEGKPIAWEMADLPEQVQSDWNELDSTSHSYIKNKPCYNYIEPSGVIWESDSAGTSGQGSLMLVDLVDGRLIEGETYRLTVDGVETTYTCAADADGDELYIGTGYSNERIYQSNTSTELRAFTSNLWNYGAKVRLEGPLRRYKKLDVSLYEAPAVDSTLTKIGQAADAAVVGQNFSALSEEIVTTAESKVAAHNTGTDTHSDIRLLIQGLTDRLNALADSDDTTMDQLSEVVAYIKSNRSLIEAITTSKVSVADIVDNLTTNVANKPLSAAQGVALKALIDAISVPDKLPNPNALTLTGAVSATYDGSAPVSVEIPSGGGGGSSGGAGKAKSQILIDQEITELTASLSVTLEHDFHNLIAIINCSSAGAALTAGSDGTAVASKIGLIIDSTDFGWNSQKVAYVDASTATWATKMIGAEWSNDLSVFKRGFAVEISTGKAQQYYFPFGGAMAMYGTLAPGDVDNAPRTGKTANIVVNGAYLNVGTRVILWGEYYE